MIHIYTDGASRGNPGRGGFATILVKGTHRKEISKGFKHTTNNRMELLAVITGLEALKQMGEEVTVTSDSKYVVDAINQKWIFGWIKKDWKGVKNSDLWKRFFIVYKKHKVTMKWIKGHNDHSENELCDLLATTAADSGQLHIDTWYEQHEAHK